MYNNNETMLVHEIKINSVVRRNEYKKDDKVVKVLYYNNGLVTESIDDNIITSRNINEEEKQSILKHYDKLRKLRKILDKINSADSEVHRIMRETFRNQLNRS